MWPCYICMENEDGTYRGIYCHTLHWLTGVGAMLSDHYKNRKSVEWLMSVGPIERLSPTGVIPYDKDTEGYRKEFDHPAQLVDLNDYDDPDTTLIGYVYVYGLDNKWRCFESGEYKIKGLTDLDEAIDEEYKGYGFPRNFVKGYGIFFPKDIRMYQEMYQKSLKKQKEKDAEM